MTTRYVTLFLKLPYLDFMNNLLILYQTIKRRNKKNQEWPVATGSKIIKISKQNLESIW